MKSRKSTKPLPPKKKPKNGYQWVWNLMTNKWVEQPIDTPWSCRVDSETFWSQ